MRRELTRLPRAIATDEGISLAGLETQLRVGEDLDAVAFGLPLPLLVCGLFP